jgi:hypothetical protein
MGSEHDRFAPREIIMSIRRFLIAASITIGSGVGVATPVSATTDPGIYPATQTVNGFVNKPITPTAVYTDVGVTKSKDFFIAPDSLSLPPGLTINENTGVVSGTPTVATTGRVVRVQMEENEDGNLTFYATITFNIAVASLAPATQTVSASTGQAITPTTAITATGFDTPTYTVSPALPAGLALNATTGVISGTPTAVTTAATYTITATQGTLTASTTVSIGVVKGTTTIRCRKGTTIRRVTAVAPKCPEGFVRVRPATS